MLYKNISIFSVGLQQLKTSSQKLGYVPVDIRRKCLRIKNVFND